MSAVLEASGVITSITGALVVSSITGLLIDHAIVLISAADAQLTDGTNNSTGTNLSVSQEERRRYLDELQSETTRTMIPALVFLVAIAVTGLVGNTLVIVVYTRKPQWTGTSILIITIAAFDLLANIVAVPGEIYDMLHIRDAENATVCRARLYITAFTTISSAFCLDVVAVTRYRKVCCPQELQITPRRAKIISITVSSLAALFSTPYFIIMGRLTVKTPRSDIVGYECSTSDDYVHTVFPLAIYIFYLFLYVACSLTLTVLYILIGVTAWKHRRTYGLSALGSTRSTLCGTTYRHNSDGNDQPLNQNECNCRRCRRPYNKNIDTSFTGKIAIQSTSHGDEIKKKRFLARNEACEAPVQNNVPVFTDLIDLRTPAVVEFFVNLHKTKPGKADPASHEGSHPINTDHGHKIAKGNSSGEDTRTPCIRMIGSNNSNIKMRTIKSAHGDIDSYGKYTERITYSINDKTVININGIDNNRHHPQSIETAANEILNEYEPWSMFNWLDITYCPNDEHTFDSNGVERETSLSFVLRLNNKLLPQTEWLRAGVIKAMERPDKMTKSSDSCPLPSSAVDFITSLPSSGQCDDSGFPDTNNTQLDMNVLRMRLQERNFRISSVLRETNEQYITFTRRAGRTTVMLFIISAFYILAYLPHLCLKIASFLSPSVFQNMSMRQRSLCNFFIRTFFVNSAVNPIVYSLFDGNFRQECFKILKCSSTN